MTFELGARAKAAGYKLASFEAIGSTNAEGLARARAGEGGPLWLVTDQQTAGRGRRLRQWVSPKGNLAASVLEVVDTPRAAAATLAFAAGLAVVSALEHVAGETGSGIGPFQLKWPNDIIVCGQKLAGILIETESTPAGLAIVTGIGLNVVAAPEGTPYPAVSLAALGVETNAARLFAALSDSWDEVFARWDSGRGFPGLRPLWLERAAGLGGTIVVQDNGTLIEGIFETIDDTGALVLSCGGERMTISAGDVHFGSVRSAGTV